MTFNKQAWLNLFKSMMISVVILSCACSSVPVPLVSVPKVPPIPKPIRNVKVALVLGGGGVRGLAHVGVLEVLEENHIPIDLIVGSSVGSIVGAMYADCQDVGLLKKKLIKLKRKDLIDTSILNIFGPRLGGPIQGKLLQRYLIDNLTAQNFEELNIPFIAVATSLRTNKIYTFRSGPIVPAVHASSALPLLFTPVFIYDDIFIDGSVIAPVPVSVARYFDPKVVIAVDISTRPSPRKVVNIFDLAYRSLHISYYELSRIQSKYATVLIHPDLSQFGTFQDNYNEQIYQIGRKAALEALPRIKKALSLCNSKVGCSSRWDPHL